MTDQQENSGKRDRSGAESLVETFVEAGVDVCFANPGTSEMHFVAALDSNPKMRCVLGLFEGVVTGAADGFGRMRGTPAATLTHLGPGLGNGLANLHNAKKARTPIVNVIGDHATFHRQYDAPLSSDVAGIAAPVSGWLKVSESADDVAQDGAEAVQASMSPPGQVASLILPADTAWNRTEAKAAPLPKIAAQPLDVEGVDSAAAALHSGKSTVILMNGILTEARLILANKIAQKTGARIISDTFISRMRRGAGIPEILRLPYFGEQAADVLQGVEHLILVSSQPPITFFAYPDKPNWLTPDNCQIHTLVDRDGDVDGALEALCDAVGALALTPIVAQPMRPDAAKGELNPMSVGQSLAHYFPENAIVVDEGGTCGAGSAMATASAPAHDWLMLTGGSIGYGLPTATGAAIACPDRRVINLQADGSAMYTVQALWTQVRENLDITTIILANRKYAILQIEFARVGAHNPGPKAMSMLDLTRPDLDWVSLAKGMGMNAWQADSAESFNQALERSLATPGPSLIEALV